MGDYGDILLMPVTGSPLLENGYPDQPDQGYGSRFDKADERASAGYYRTILKDYGIEVELTATERTGLHRYVFPADEPAHVIVDLEHRDAPPVTLTIYGHLLRKNGQLDDARE